MSLPRPRPPGRRLGRRRELAAAVCWRWESGGGLRLGLVSTHDGARWTFPKGHRERGETLAETAAREAREEAGLGGAVDPRWRRAYRYPGRGRSDVLVTAFLLHVTDVGPPEETFRELVWCDAQTARRRLAEGRDEYHADELARVVDAAVVEVAGSWARPAGRRLARRLLRRAAARSGGR